MALVQPSLIIELISNYESKGQNSNRFLVIIFYNVSDDKFVTSWPIIVISGKSTFLDLNYRVTTKYNFKNFKHNSNEG